MRWLFALCLAALGCGSCGSTAKEQSVVESPTTIQMVGNSMLAWNVQGIRRELSHLLNDMSDKKIIVKDSSFPGAMIAQIAEQWRKAKASGKIDIAIVEGGANNIFFNAWWCWTPADEVLKEECKTTVESTMAEMSSLIQEVQASGVKKVILLVPYHLRGFAAAFNPALDYSLSFWSDICHGSCTLIELSNWIKPSDESLYWIDGVHPSARGSRRIAKVIYSQLMNIPYDAED